MVLREELLENPTLKEPDQVLVTILIALLVVLNLSQDLVMLRPGFVTQEPLDTVKELNMLHLFRQLYKLLAQVMSHFVRDTNPTGLKMESSNFIVLHKRNSKETSKSDGYSVEEDLVWKSMELDRSLLSVITVELIHRFNTQIGSSPAPLLKETRTPVQLLQFRDHAQKMLLSVTEELQATPKEPTFLPRT